jgi:hypothetical protein
VRTTQRAAERGRTAQGFVLNRVLRGLGVSIGETVRSSPPKAFHGRYYTKDARKDERDGSEELALAFSGVPHQEPRAEGGESERADHQEPHAS